MLDDNITFSTKELAYDNHKNVRGTALWADYHTTDDYDDDLIPISDLSDGQLCRAIGKLKYMIGGDDKPSDYDEDLCRMYYQIMLQEAKYRYEHDIVIDEPTTHATSQGEKVMLGDIHVGLDPVSDPDAEYELETVQVNYPDDDDDDDDDDDEFDPTTILR